MVPLIGYADRLSVRPGETIAFKVSSAADWSDRITDQPPNTVAAPCESRR